MKKALSHDSKMNFKSKKYAESMSYYQKAINLRKFSIEARLGFIAPSDASKQFDKSFQKYLEILEIDPYHKTANYWVGVNYYTIKKYDLAQKYFQLLVNMYPFDYDCIHMLGWTYLNSGNFNDAKVLFQKALLYNPSDASSKEGLSKCK
jgi:tetratricopeptide (TPR) repeat protein